VQVPSSTVENPRRQASPLGGNNLKLRSERRMPVVIALAFLPWLAVVSFTAEGWAALNFIAHAIVVFAAGYSIVIAALPAASRTETIFLVPGTGILAISAVSAFWLRLELSVIRVPALWLGLAAVGAVGLWRDRALWEKRTVAYGKTLIVLSLLICTLYFLPSAPLCSAEPWR